MTGSSSRTRVNFVERGFSRYLRRPPTVKAAARAIVTATALIVVGAGILIRFVDHSEFDNVWIGMWWALQTVTTVGYGDIVPKHLTGRIIAALVMLQGVAFLTIVTAAITSTFVRRAAMDAALTDDSSDRALIERRFDDLEAKLDRLADAATPDVTREE